MVLSRNVTAQFIHTIFQDITNDSKITSNVYRHIFVFVDVSTIQNCEIETKSMILVIPFLKTLRDDVIP